MDDKSEKKRRPPPAVWSADPEEGLEEKLRHNPRDADTKVDVGSDESMDASDPPSVVQPVRSDPAPSSSAPDEDR